MNAAEEFEHFKQAPADEGIIPTILQRWSPRAFSTQEVEADKLERLFRACRWAPSSMNDQPWRFILGHRGRDAAYDKLFACLGDWNKAWAGPPPVLVLVLANKLFRHNGAENRYHLHDAGAAAAYLVLQAAYEGLHSHQMAGYDNATARSLFGFPDHYGFGTMIAIGYRGEPHTLPEEYQEEELEARSRRTLDSFVFTDQWEKPYSFGA